MDSPHPLFRRFENQLTVGESTLEWTMRGAELLFRPVDADVRIIWSELRGSYLDDPAQNSARLKRNQERITKNIALKRLWRFWPLDSERELALSPRSALMRYRDANFWLRLDWQEPVDIDELLHVADAALLLSRLEPSDEPWAFLEKMRAEDMGNLSWFQCIHGEMNELKRVLRACLALYGGSFYASKSTDLHFRWLLHAPYNAGEDEHKMCNRVRFILDAHFTLQWHPLSARTYSPQGKPAKRPAVSFRVPPLTSEHERLEAMLVWRDFLRDKVPSEEIEALLSL